MKSELSASAESSHRYSMDTDVPSDRNCSPQLLQCRGMGPYWAPRLATAAWGVEFFHRLTRELLSSVLLFRSNATAAFGERPRIDWLLLCKICSFIAEFCSVEELVLAASAHKKSSLLAL
jgi:hypothetical protein